MFQLGSKFVGKGGGKDVWTVVEVVLAGAQYKARLADGTERIFSVDQMVNVSQASGGIRKGSF